jgi:hypothetical protein
MKKVFYIIFIATLLSACESSTSTKITGTLSGNDTADISELQVYVDGDEARITLSDPATVKDGQFTLKLSAVPNELTVPWLNIDGSEYMCTAEAEIVAESNGGCIKSSLSLRA